MTSEEKQEIIAAVLSAIKTNSALITDLTEVTTVPDDGYIEFSGGRRIKGSTLQSIIQTAIANNVVAPSIASEASARESADTTEKSARESADTALQASITALQTICTNLDTNKFAKANVVQETGTATDKVMSQNAVTTQLTTLDTNMKKVSLSAVHPTETIFSLSFVDASGNTSTITINGASDSYAGLLTAADYTMIHEHATSIADLVKEKITAIKFNTTAVSVEIELEKNGNDAVKATIPQASSTRAGMMNAQQAKDVAEMEPVVFPLVVNEVNDNAGVYELGDNVEVEIELGIKRRGEDITDDCTIDCPDLSVSHEGELAVFSYDGLSSDRTFKIWVSHEDDEVLKSYEYEFLRYVYGTPFDESDVEDPTTLIGPDCELQKLSKDNTLEPTTLEADKAYIFAIPLSQIGSTDLPVRDECGNEISGCTRGYVKVARQCDGDITDDYRYVIVPASKRKWRFQITNY